MYKLPFKAVLFDVDSTLIVDRKIRTETLVRTLRNLRDMGVLLFGASADPAFPSGYGFPPDLVRKVWVPDRKRWVTDMRSMVNLWPLVPNEVLCAGSRASDEEAARCLGMDFILVWGEYLARRPDHLFELEKKLAHVFGDEILSRPKIPKSKRVVELVNAPNPVSGLAPPKSFAERWPRTTRALRAAGLLRH